MAIINKKNKQLLSHAGLDVFGLGRSLPDDFSFESPCGVQFAQIMPETQMGAFSYIVSGYLFGVQIGRYCSIAEDVQIGRQNHPLTWLTTSPFFYENNKDIVNVERDACLIKERMQYTEPPTRLRCSMIGNDVWIGHGAIINAGVSLGNGVIVAAGSVVTKNAPAYSIVGGNPAQVIRYRFAADIIAKLEWLQWWRYSPVQIKGIPMNDVQVAICELGQLAASEEPYKVEWQTIKQVLAQQES
ncbi:MAG TPA: CatB-related O-acetyltransferase [Methyloprofundus sp.]|nr:CatB-related O-acetyltransferase [Methyloprofundus sp.]HIL77995.1 CatB-related O-acetyltransferase [Methylococcales bacterium]